MPPWSRKQPSSRVERAAPQPSVQDALLSERPSDIFMGWAQQGSLTEILPDLAALRAVSQLPAHRDDAFIHTLKVVDAIEPTAVRRWAALLHDIGKGPTYIETPEGRSRFFDHDRMGTIMAPEIMSLAGESPDLIDHVQGLVGLHMRPISYRPEWTDGAVRRLMEEVEECCGPSGWDDLLALSRADLRGYLPEPIDRGLWTLEQLEERRRHLLDAETQAAISLAQQPKSPLDGHEILALAALEPGPWVGQLKAYLQAMVAEGYLHREDKEGARLVAAGWLAERRTTDDDV